MVLTRSQARAAFNHVLVDKVLGKDDTSQLKSALLQEGINDIFSLVTFPLQYSNDQNILKDVKLCDRNLLCYLSEYIVFWNANMDPIQDDWMSVTHENCHSFCLIHGYIELSAINSKRDEILETSIYHEQPSGYIDDYYGEEMRTPPINNYSEDAWEESNPPHPMNPRLS
jgi:hypothetical protein